MRGLHYFQKKLLFEPTANDDIIGTTKPSQTCLSGFRPKPAPSHGVAVQELKLRYHNGFVIKLL